MGWWDEGTETLGDEPLDRLIGAMQAVAKCYREEFDREPTLAEMARTIEQAANAQLNAVAENAAIDVAVKIRSKPMKKQKVSVGDVFVIRLDRCHYGRVIYTEPALDTRIEILKTTSETPLPVRHLDFSRQNVKHHKWVMSSWCLRNCRWKIVGHVPVPADYEMPDYLMGLYDLSHGVRGSDGKSVFFPTTAEIRKRKLEPVVLLNPDIIEANLNAGNPDPWPEIRESLRDHGVR